MASENGFRRRILIEPAPDRVTAELEDEWHRMVVSLLHDGTAVRSVEAQMKRWPWSACPGALAVVERTFPGQPLARVARNDLRTANCTHLYDLGLFAAAHAGDAHPTAYDILVADPVDGRRTARLWRNGALVMEWVLEGFVFITPDAVAGKGLFDVTGWVAGLAPQDQEAARILRWASILSMGRQQNIPAGLEATAFPKGACFNFQPDVASTSRRREDAAIDFTALGTVPMADRAEMF